MNIYRFCTSLADLLSLPRHLAGFALAIGIAVAFAAPAFAASSQERVLASQRSALVVQDGRFAWPADGTVMSPYGPRGRGFHPGIDIGMLRSLAVSSATDGDVTGVGYLTGYEGYGLLVLVDIGNGYQLLYSHLARAAVRVGQHLDQGDPIGTAGCTGSCTGTHLHFELRRNGRWVDPTPFLP